MSEFVHISSVAEVHQFFGLANPAHPLITVNHHRQENSYNLGDIKLSSDLYLISLKGNMSGTFQYGRNSYDYQEGTMVFIGPDQVASFGEEGMQLDDAGWTIIFHPDLIRKSELGRLIKQFSFFNYGVNEALHLSDKESQILSELVQRIEIELNQNIDKHSQELIIVNLESILKYCQRYYDRQFYTRTNLNKDIIVRFENYLDNYFASDELSEKGMPSITECGESLDMSGPYLSDLLKMETGKSAKDHLYAHMVEKAKTLLLTSNIAVSQVAYQLGFDYPQHFSKLFKSKTGQSPKEFREVG